VQAHDEDSCHADRDASDRRRRRDEARGRVCSAEGEQGHTRSQCRPAQDLHHLEAALYFVGREAMTNAVKHTPGARILLSLRRRREARVTLEVHDDGPGFAAGEVLTTGGLQNMADRIGALGGVLSLESAPGAGTWVRAEVEEKAEVRDIRSREAMS
jgi:signal transduction histidine kinase